MLNIKIDTNSRKVDKDLYNNSAQDFIPIACHYDENTLLTKNGELLQIIQIHGVNAEKVSEKLFDLREMLRDSIRKNVKTSNFAFWIHTVRRVTNLDDVNASYDKLLPSNIHDLWKKKNYWDAKFVNTLYISIVHDAAAIKIKNLSSFVNSLFYKVIATDFHDKYLAAASANLTSLVDKILLDLTDLGATRLGIRFEGSKSFSDLMFLYRRIVHLSEGYCLVPLTDLSEALSSNRYAIGSDKIEAITEDGKKFAALISVKEYPEISPKAFDEFLQLPVEMIATEIFYFLHKKEIAENFAEQNYILSVSKDSKLSEIKKLQKIIDSKDDDTNQFCNQQISITIIADDIPKLEQSISSASELLAVMGIVHVREDINLEQCFWAQLPGNFSFLRRMTATLSDNITALASLHNFPTGEQFSIWGKAITLLRTEKGTPYFMNFHARNNRGNCCIFGTDKTGKTTLTNFLISEATKYNPTIVYIGSNNDSKLFIEAIEGTWIENETTIINPFLLEDNDDSRIFVYEFLKIICNHYVITLTEPELEFLKIFRDKIFAIDKASRIFSNILKEMDFSSEGGVLISEKLSHFKDSAIYHKLFDETKISLSEAKVVGLNLYEFSDISFKERFYPKERKYLDKFTTDSKRNTSISTAIIYAISYHLSLVGNRPKILAIDSLDSFCKTEIYIPVMTMISNKLQDMLGILLCNFNFDYIKSEDSSILNEWLDLIDTKIILPSEVKLKTYNALGLNVPEIEKLSKFSVNSRVFLISQNNQSVIVELSISGLPAIVRILLSKDQELEIYNKILKDYPGHPDNWLIHLYDELNHN